MLRAAIKATVLAFYLLFCVFEMVMPSAALSDTCSDGTGVPPFLGAETVKPNLLLMLDNSRSMYDLSYVADLSSCYDDSFAPDSLNYGGYFLTIEEYQKNTEVWYEYGATGGKFSGKFSRTIDPVICSTATASITGTLVDAEEARYSSNDVCLIMNETYIPIYNEEGEEVGQSLDEQEVLYFAATGKFLNWLASSKMDIQKLVLTGGKFLKADPNGTSGDEDDYIALVPESRGCNEQKMIKEVTVDRNGFPTSPASRLTLAVRSDGYDEVDDNGDGFIADTFIDIYGATKGGFDSGSCERALSKFMAGGAPGTWKIDLQTCLGFDKNADNELNRELISVYNEGTQECWQVLNKGGPSAEGGSWRLTDVAQVKAQCARFYENSGVDEPIASPVQPWELTKEGSSVTGAYCSGAWDPSNELVTTSGYPDFVGRCWLPANQTYLPEVPELIGKLPESINTSMNQTVGRSEEEPALLSGQGYESKRAALSPKEDGDDYQFATAKNSKMDDTVRENTVLEDAGSGAEEPSRVQHNVIQALKAFISTNGSGYYRAKVLRAVKEFFVAEVEAGSYTIEETAAGCTGKKNTDFKLVNGAISGDAYEYSSSDKTCYFEASNLAVPLHGYYYIYIKAPCARDDADRRDDVPLEITHYNAASNQLVSTLTTFDQKASCGDWVKLTKDATGPDWSYELLGDGSGGVLLTTNATTPPDPRTFVYADAVRFELKQPIYTLGSCDIDPTPGIATVFEAEDETFQSTDNFQRPSSSAISGKVSRVDLGPLDPPAKYYMHFIEPGTYYVWLYAAAPSEAGNDNSAWYGLDGKVLGNISTQDPFTTDEDWINKHWVSPAGSQQWDGPLVAQIDVPTDGDHAFNLWSREASFKINKIAVTRSSAAIEGMIQRYLYPNQCSDLEPPEPPPASIPCPDESITAGATGAWICDACIEQAVIRFCYDQFRSNVVDPSNPLDTSGLGDYLIGDGYTNAPGLWWFGAVEGQLGEPLLSMSSRVEVDSEPSGLIHEFASKIRMGVMRFRELGTRAECGDYSQFQDCTSGYYATDGAQVVIPIASGKSHIQSVINKINETDAATWTPLAEAMYTAIGYYAQDPAMRLNHDPVNPPPLEEYAYSVNSDVDTTGLTSWVSGNSYSVGDRVIKTVLVSDTETQDIVYEAVAVGQISDEADCLSKGNGVHDDECVTWQLVHDPVIAHCQRNFVLPITEGMSTADLHADVVSFARANGDPDLEIDVGTPQAASPSLGCDALKGSTYFDDLAYYAWHGKEGKSIFKYEPWAELDVVDGSLIKRKNNIEIHMANTSSARGDLEGECLPSQLLGNVSKNTKPIRFVDINGDGSFDVDTTGDEVKDSDWPLYYAGDPDSLFDALHKVFEILSESSSSGSAASVISASRSGEGALYQAIFWPDTKTNLGAGNPEFVEWTGQVHAFLIDGTGNLREDTNGNGALDADDNTIIVAYDNEAGTTKACINSTLDPETGVCRVPTVDLNKVKYLWNAAEWLNNPLFDRPNNIRNNRIQVGGSQTFTAENDGTLDEYDKIKDDNRQRFIFTWNDLDNDGEVDSVSEILPFTEFLGSTSFPVPDPEVGSRGPVHVDFGIDPDDLDKDLKVNRIINWIRGEDQGALDKDDTYTYRNGNSATASESLQAMRSRKMLADLDLDDTPETPIYWKLGDIIHSTPVQVSRPAENYHQLYRDTTYAQFVSRWHNRRHMIYYGGNDGMLHAVNGGFYKEALRKFCRTDDCGDAGSTPVLGEEMWAYVPYNLLPHLKCLTEPSYEHKYYVDMRPRIFDVQIFTPEGACNKDAEVPTPLADGCIHPNGWGTILVGGMRFGGAPVKAGDIHPGDTRVFTSAYFIFDITNPETLPTLLGEFTRTIDPATMTSPEVELGYTTVIPTIVAMKEGTTTEWNLILGSGPTDLDGTSDQNARLAVIPLHDRMNPGPSLPSVGSLKSLRIPAAAPPEDTDHIDFGTIYISDENSFVSDLISIDYETTQNYKTDVVYFGTVSGTWGTWGGKLYRLVTRKTNNSKEQEITSPYQWSSLLGDPPGNPNVLYDPGQPIVSAPTVGTDGLDFWVYFGTGRFFDVDDKTDVGSNALQTYYGIREPIDCGNDFLTFSGFNWKTVPNVTPTSCPIFGNNRGEIGLLPVEDIAIRLLHEDTDNDGVPDVDLNNNGILDTVSSVSETTPGVVGCYDAFDGTFVADIEQCFFDNGIPLPPTGDGLRTNASFDDLLNYVVGSGVHCWENAAPGFDGWSKDMSLPKERNLGQATLLGGLLSYSSYIPSSDICSPEGSGYLYGVYYQTGTPWYKDVFGRNQSNYNEPIGSAIFLGAGLSTTPNIHVGEQPGGKAFIQTSVGQIIEIPQPNLPLKDPKSGMIKWRDIQ